MDNLVICKRYKDCTKLPNQTKGELCSHINPHVRTPGCDCACLGNDKDTCRSLTLEEHVNLLY